MSNRVIAVIIVTVMLLAALCINVAADVPPTVAAGSAATKTGETVDIPITLSGCAGFASLGIEIGYDSEKFTLEAVTPTFDGANYTTAQTLQVNPYILMWVSPQNTTYNGKLVTLKFKVKDNVPVGSYPITVDYYKGRWNNWTDEDVNFDENKVPLNLNYTNGAINVIEGTHTITVTAGSKSVTLSSDDVMTGVIIIKLYDTDNELIDVKMYSAATSEINFTSDKSGANVAVMWWYDSQTSLEPVCKKQIMSLQ